MSPLRRRMIEDMQIRNLTPNTQRVYVTNIGRFASYFCKSPERLGPAEIRAYLLFLANDKRLTVSSISVAVAALRFLYTVTLKRRWAIEDNIPAGRRGNKLPVVLSQEEVARFLAAVEKPETPHGSDRLLRSWSADLRSRPPHTRGHRQPTYGHPGRAG